MNQKLIEGAHTSHISHPTSQKGITLIALVITIIVLLILAGVTISMVLGDDGIIAQAQQAKQAQEKAEGKEKGAISSAEGTISRYSMGKYDASKNNGIATQNSTINGEKASSSNPVIPKGFKAVSTADDSKVTTTWGTSSADEGLVIQDEAGNQFVWVPVEDAANFTTLTSGYYNGSLQNYIGREPDTITGKTSTVDGKTVSDLTGTQWDAVDAHRKAILDDGYENTNAGLKKQFTDEYNSMVESVKAYGGFYVGRYETGWNETNSVVVSKPGVPMTAATELKEEWIKTDNSNENNQATWYGLYAKQKELYKKDSSSSVVSGMIYGCQWDAIMNWMSDVPCANDNTKMYICDSTTMGWDSMYSGSRVHETGEACFSNRNRVKNVYDLAGNCMEWTQEVDDTKFRIGRGGAFRNFASVTPVSFREKQLPYLVRNDYSSRLQLYIK